MKTIKIISRFGEIERFANEKIAYFDLYDSKAARLIKHFILLDEYIKLMYESWLERHNNYIIKKEEKVLGHHYGHFPEWKDNKQVAIFVWNSDILSEKQCEYLSSLPEQIVVSLPGTDEIRIVHGSPFNINEGLDPNVNIEKIKECADQIKEKVLICGHTHNKFIMEANDKLILNPGAVGLPINKEAQAEYIILEWSENKWVPQHRFVRYDKEKLESDFHSSGLYEAARVAIRIVLYTMKIGNDGFPSFLKLGYKLAKERGFEGSLIPNEVWFEAEEKWNWDKWMPL